MSSQVNLSEQQQRAMQKMQALIKNDPQVAAAIPLEEVGEAICAPGLSLAHTMDVVFSGYAARAAVGGRDYTIVQSSATGRYERSYQPAFKTLTYAQLQKRIHALASAWKNDPRHRVEPDECICIFGFVSVEFAILDFATAYIHAITVPMQTGTAHMNVEEIFDAIKPAVVAVTANDLLLLARQVAGKPYIRSLVVYEYDSRADNEREAFAAAQEILASGGADTALVSLQELEALGDAESWRHPEPHPLAGERTASIVYTSGSTGTAKAAVISEKILQFHWTNIVKNAPPIISLCMAPFSHLLGKGVLASALKQGGTAYFTLAPDMSTLFEDIRLARPTFMGLFPRIIELVYQHYQNEVERHLRGSGEAEAVVERIKREIGASYLGDRLCFALSGGSQIAQPVKEFFVDCFGAHFMDAYGNTEGGQVALNGIVQCPPVTEYRLRDVPELGYYRTDKPYPRGEFCFKSILATSGYYNAPEATAKLFDEDGFICTGDIVEEYAPNHIAVIDRRNDVLKLSQGEYVPVGTLGSIFEGGSDVIAQIYVYGNSQRSYLLAVVVPNKDIVTARLGADPEPQALNELIQQELHRVAKQEGIRSFEVPKDFIIEWEPFTEENGLLSGLRKKLRPVLARKYGPRLEALYERHEQENREKRRTLTDPNSSLTVVEKLIRLLEVDLNIKVVDSAASASFYQLGGDSLGAVLLSRSIEEIFAVDLPADKILSPTGNLHKWAEAIQRELSGSSGRPTAASVHGKETDKIRGSDLTLDKFINPDTLQCAGSLPKAAAEARTVFITGANGFLGRFVCLAWLEKLAPLGGKVICLIRAADHAAAKARLDSAYLGLDPELEARYLELSGDHLEVVAGEVGDAEFGLSAKDYLRLAAEVDRVVHVAALVNHRFSYAHLFGANVVGTAEVIRFALTLCRKSIDFISTVAVYPFLDTRELNSEDAPLAEQIKIQTDNYAVGYGASKWASEHLLRRAQRDYGLPVNVFRGDMMLPHQVYQGQINAADMFIRLLYSIIHTGLAPYSFYPLQQDGGKISAHYDGLPVDVVAAAVVGADTVNGEYRTYNIANYHRDDGCSLDTFVDWIEAAGYPITRIKNYQSWYDTFREKLTNLPEEQQQHSALDILEAFAAPQTKDTATMRCDRFRTLVRNLPIGPEVPHLSQRYLEKCLHDMSLLGLIGNNPR